LIPRRYRPAAAAAFLIVVSLIVLSYHAKRSGPTGAAQQAVMELASPFSGAVSAVTGGISGAWKRYLFLVGMQQENQDLRRSNALLMQELIRYREGYLEGQRLQRLLGLKQQIARASLAARVVGRDRAGVFKTMLVDRGTSDGVRAGYPVLGEQGLVGRIIAASPHVSQVLLLIDEGSNVDVLVQRTRVQGVLQGSSGGMCIVKYIPRTEDVKVGDVVLTSGLSGVFPAGWLVGMVSAVSKADAGLFLRIEVVPAVNVTKIEEVLVVLPQERTRS
jgi:rod shape-determining protein MreC